METFSGILLLFLLVLQVHGRPQQNTCDPVFDENCSVPKDDSQCEVFFDDCDTPESVPTPTPTTTTPTPTTPPKPPKACFDSADEITDAKSEGDTRYVFNDCDKSRKCDSYARDRFICSEVWTCNQNRTIISDGSGVHKIEANGDISVDSTDTKCPIYQVCCQDPDFRASRPGDLKEQSEETFREQAPRFAVCGRSSKKFQSTGGDNDKLAQPTEFPHMCAIYRVINRKKNYIGGASLIARNKVMTVAHKFLVNQGGGPGTDLTEEASSFFVRCGDYNLVEDTELLTSQESEVEEILIHPDYDKKKVYNNLAIVVTKKNFIYQEHIGPVCLPRPNEKFENEKGQSGNCFSTGWGSDQWEQGKYNNALEKLELAVADREECERDIARTDQWSGRGFKLHDSWMCIGGEAGKDTCKGHGGSPHVCKSLDGSRWIQVGAVAWGVDCGQPVPSIYSSIPHAMCWIDWVMTCKDEALTNIDDHFNGVTNLRTTEIDSVNGFTGAECQGWLDSNPALAQECRPQYFF